MIVSGNNRIIPDESTGSSVVTVINYGDRIDANTAKAMATITITTEHTSTRDNSSHRSGTFIESSQQNDNITDAIESSIVKCIQATKSLSIQSNESPPASSSLTLPPLPPPPPLLPSPSSSQSSTHNTIGSDKNQMGSGTKYKQCKNQFLNENHVVFVIKLFIIIILKLVCFFFFKFFGHKK